MSKDNLRIPEDNSEVNPEAQEDPKPGSPEYNEAMSKKFLERQEAALKGEDENRDDFSKAMPEGGQEKFYNKETGEYDWASHVKELEWKLGQREKPEEVPAKEGEEPANTDEEVTDLLAANGLDADELGREIVETGTINDAAKAKLLKAGIPEVLIDNYIQMASQYADNALASAIDYAGGEDEWNKLSTWAAQNLPDDEKNGINELLSSSDKWKVGIDLLKYKRRESDPAYREGKRRTGDRAGGSTGSYETKDHWLADINSDEYKRSPEFRRQVALRAMNSDFNRTSRW